MASGTRSFLKCGSAEVEVGADEHAANRLVLRIGLQHRIIVAIVS